MDKNTFFNSFTRKSEQYEMPDGTTVELTELTLGQRGKVQEMVKNDPSGIRAQAGIVAMSCPMLDENDIDRLMEMPGAVIKKMSDAVIRISGLDDDEDAEKN